MQDCGKNGPWEIIEMLACLNFLWRIMASNDQVSHVEAEKKMFIGMSNIKCYYWNSKCDPSLVPVYCISVPKDFLLWKRNSTLDML